MRSIVALLWDPGPLVLDLRRTPAWRNSQRAPSTHLVEWASLPCLKRRDFKKGVEHIVPANGAFIRPWVPLG
jgi:hypothetical protein